MNPAHLTRDDAETFERCMSVGGVALFPTDTVYGLACEPDDAEAVRRVYAVKGRLPDKPAAVMFFDVLLALEAVHELGPITRDAIGRLLPGQLTLLLPNPAGRFPLACAGAPDVLGLRVPLLDGPLAALTQVRWPVLQTSANESGAGEARKVQDIPETVRRECDLILDAGELPGVASTVVDLTRFEATGSWELAREGAVSRESVSECLGGWA